MEFPFAGSRIAVRPFELTDSQAMHAIFADERVMRWVGDGPVSDLQYTEAMLRDYVLHQREHGFSVWAVVEQATGAVIGDAGLYTRDEGVELGYTLAHAYWNRGYGTEAAGVCLDAAFGQLGLDELIAIVRPENIPSVSILTRLGFRAAGQLTAYGAHHTLYRLTHRTFRPRQLGNSR